MSLIFIFLYNLKLLFTFHVHLYIVDFILTHVPKENFKEKVDSPFIIMALMGYYIVLQ